MIARRLGSSIMLFFLVVTLVASCAEAPPPPPPPPPAMEPPPPSPLYFVNVSNLALREGPTTAAPIITTLDFNEEVEVLDWGPGGWARVRELRRGIVGWASGRYLQPAPAYRPRSVAPKRRAPAPSKEEPEKPPTPAPKVM